MWKQSKKLDTSWQIPQLFDPYKDDSPWYIPPAIDKCNSGVFNMAAVTCVKARSAPSVEINQAIVN